MRTMTAIVALMLLAAASAAAQSTIPGWSEKAPTHKQVVAFVAPATATVTAGKPTELELRFSIREGMHINAHTPSYPELIPTTLSADDDSEAELTETKYPDGTDLMLGSNPPEKLNVYTTEFLLYAHVRAKAGLHTLKLKLRYQACTMSACMPPRTIPVTIELIAK